MNWKIIGISSLFIIPIFVVLALGFGRNPHEVPFMLTGKRAPQFKLKRLDNNEFVSLSELRGKTPFILNFWSTYCAPCRVEHPVLEWGNRTMGDKIAFYGVVYEDTESNVISFLRQNPSTIIQLIDPMSQIAVDYGLAGVPETYFIDIHGNIRYKHIGPIDAETLMMQANQLLK